MLYLHREKIEQEVALEGCQIIILNKIVSRDPILGGGKVLLVVLCISSLCPCNRTHNILMHSLETLFIPFKRILFIAIYGHRYAIL